MFISLLWGKYLQQDKVCVSEAFSGHMSRTVRGNLHSWKSTLFTCIECFYIYVRESRVTIISELLTQFYILMQEFCENLYLQEL